MTLTAEDILKLTYPFRREDHDFLEGYVYISEEAITERIERVDPEWKFHIQQMIAYGDSVVCIASMTIKGVERSNGGGNPVQRDKAEKDKSGNKTGGYALLPLYTQADNGVNAHKAAITDALKRCARLFGIGRYLLSAPKEGGMFDKWLEQQHADARAALLKLSQVDQTTGELKQPPDPKATAPGSTASTATGQPNGDAFAKQFPPAGKWTPAMLYDATHDYFSAREHFDNHWDKHEADYAGKTLEEASAFVRAYHWNYDKDACDKLKAFGMNALAMTANEILAALAEANGHSVKRWKDWDGGDFSVAQGALLAWSGGYDFQGITNAGLNMGLPEAVINAAQDFGEQYRHEQAAKDLAKEGAVAK